MWVSFFETSWKPSPNSSSSLDALWLSKTSHHETFPCEHCSPSRWFEEVRFRYLRWARFCRSQFCVFHSLLWGYRHVLHCDVCPLFLERSTTKPFSGFVWWHFEHTTSSCSLISTLFHTILFRFQDVHRLEALASRRLLEPVNTSIRRGQSEQIDSERRVHHPDVHANSKQLLERENVRPTGEQFH